MDGEPGSDAEVLRVFDVNGAELGISHVADTFFHEPTGIPITVQRDGNLVTSAAPTVLYESVDCSGTVLIEEDTGAPGTLYNAREGLVVIENATLPSVKTIQSGIPSGRAPDTRPRTRRLG